ncbi:MAG: hypothetical protein HYV52_01275 [Parcubacteria group bacterium]|nr:hypothetical protein [Parcubacteria group bacterium]
MKLKSKILIINIIILLGVFGISKSSFALVAFPGAEGFGANSVGGRGGQVIRVTNLNDNGPGSFREAVTASEARIVIFGVSGIINLQSDVEIYNPYIY